jgi:hypothetical protein
MEAESSMEEHCVVVTSLIFRLFITLGQLLGEDNVCTYDAFSNTEICRVTNNDLGDFLMLLMHTYT